MEAVGKGGDMGLRGGEDWGVVSENRLGEGVAEKVVFGYSKHLILALMPWARTTIAMPASIQEVGGAVSLLVLEAATNIDPNSDGGHARGKGRLGGYMKAAREGGDAGLLGKED